MGALEERERIAREMHDGLAQVLSYTLTKSQAARCLMSSGQQSKAGVELTELENSVQEVYADVREAILGLRTPAARGKDLISVLREYVLRFSQMSGVKAELETDDAKVNPLSPGAEFQIIRIVQEALTNVRKHAGARNAWVKIRRSNEHGPWGEPADDITALAINYLFFSVRMHGDIRGAYREAFDLFFDEFIRLTGDQEIVEAVAPFFAFRGVVVANPVFYPELTSEQRESIFTFVRNVLDAERFDYKKIYEYLM